MRLVSMVPSWTELLLECGFNVVGRTRYCIHPKNKVDPIAIVGGTKDISWTEIEPLKPDLIIFDQEENPKRFADQCPYPWWASHIENLKDVQRDLLKLRELFEQSAPNSNLQKLDQVIVDWKAGGDRKILVREHWSNLPGLIQWIHQPEKDWQPERVLYVIWKDPWMAVSSNTFIGSMCEKLAIKLPKFETKYPKIDLEKYDPKSTLVLFSSEPYPFAQHLDQLKDLKFPSALINGESFSWFGVRSLNFLLESLDK